MKVKLLKANQYLQTLAIHRPQTYLPMKLVQIASPYFGAMILSKIRFEDYVEFKHYVHDIMTL